MTAPISSNPHDIRDRLENLVQEIGSARMLLARGTLIDLTGLDHRIAVVCEAANALPKTDSGVVADVLQTLVDELEELAAAIVRHQPSSSGSAASGEEGEHRRASQAYTRTPRDPER
jgi:hypothetical protein